MQARPYPSASWALILHASRPTQLSGHPGPHTQLCQEPPSPINDLKQVLGSLGPPDRLQKPALPATSVALTPGSSFTCQWVSNSPRGFGTLAPPTSEPALALGPPRIPQWATSWSGPAKQQPAASVQGRTWQPTRLGPTKPTRPPTKSAHHNKRTHTALLGGTPRAYTLGD